MTIRIIWQSFIFVCLLVLALPDVRLFYFSTGARWQYVFLFAFFMSYFLIPFCRSLALRLGALDKPDWRKIHDSPTPLLGGVGISLAFVISLLMNNVFLPGMDAIVAGGSMIFLMGLADDIRALPASVRFIIQILISLFVIVWGDIHITFFYHEQWADLLNIPLTVLWMVGLTNAMNFFDGVDGLAASLSVIAAFFLGIIAFKTNQPALGWFAVALVGSCLGFLPYNFRLRGSALLFLGDAGSTFLGFTLAGLAVLGKWSNTSNFVSITAPILIFGVLIFDMTYVSLSRIKNRQARSFLQLLTCPNKDHLHHRLIGMGFTHKETVFIISTMSSCLGMSALIIMDQQFIDGLLGILQALLILGLITTLMLKGRECVPPNAAEPQPKLRVTQRV